MTETDNYEMIEDTETEIGDAETGEEPMQAAPVTDSGEEQSLTVVSIKFRNRGKMYFFDPAGFELSPGTAVIVETSKGLEIGDVVQKNHQVSSRRIVQPLRSVVRLASDEDEKAAERCRRREREAYVICKRKIAEHGLEMKLVDVECSFEGNKILFFFSSDGRVDFRELVKDLAGVFRTRIELRQIGVRDEARMLGGLGICGRPFCCGCFMDEFRPVSTKMAKTQSMSLNPAKISGSCGRLMCCLRYEQEAYESLVRNVPKNGAFVETPDGYGNVTQVNILRQTVKVKLDGMGDDTVRSYETEDVAVIPGGRPKDGSQPPHVLVLRPRAARETEETESARWQMPEMIASAPAREERLSESGRKPNQRRKGKRDGARKENAPENAEQQRPQNRPQQKTRQPKPEKAGGERPQREGEERRSGQPRKNHGQHHGKPQNRPVSEEAKQPRDRNQSGESGQKNPHNRRRHYKPHPKPNGGGNAAGKTE